MSGNPNKALYRAAVEQAARATSVKLLPHVDPHTALQQIVDRLNARLLHAQNEVDQLRPGQLTVMTAFGPIDHEWLRMETSLTAQLTKLCIDIAKVGLAERLVQVEEARANLIVRAFTAAALESGISRDQLRQVAPKFREQLQLLQGAGADERVAA